MPYRVTKYACSNCHKLFDDFELAKQHEDKCNKCNRCEHAYYVYGCEFNCEYIKDCGYPTYPHFQKRK